MCPLIQHVSKNRSGRDFIVGDIHGAFSKLKACLDEIHFNSEVDRLFSVGDMVDRGAESHKVTKWLKKPWFFAVRGNHEQLVIDSFLYAGQARKHHQTHGGEWFYREPPEKRSMIVNRLAKLPLLIELETDQGAIGIVHADCPINNWQDLKQEVLPPSPNQTLIQACQWSRSRVRNAIDQPISGIHRIIIGHTVVEQPVQLSNVICIETAGWREGRQFTLLDANRLN
ncbi:metallophosphoesterase [Pseudomonas sp. F1_0610]|uniref:metallophosphoesterase n=1 Tax=Pseudomonas sp. F1_0610 TaxID=3114284 RepID=UPI0039C22031